MKTASRILLYGFGALAIADVLVVIFFLFIGVITTIFNISFNGLIVFMSALNFDYDFISALLAIKGFSDPIYTVLRYLGFETGEFSRGYLVGYFTAESFLYIISLVLTALRQVPGCILLTVAGIFGLIGGSKKPKKGIHIMNAVCGGLIVYLFAGVAVIGMGLIAGGVLGIISDNKLLPKEKDEPIVPQDAVEEEDPITVVEDKPEEDGQGPLIEVIS